MAPTSPRLPADALPAYAMDILQKALSFNSSRLTKAEGVLAADKSDCGPSFDELHEPTPEGNQAVASPLDAVKTWFQDEHVPQSIKDAFVEQLEQTQQSQEVLRLVTDFCGYHAPLLHPSHEEPLPETAEVVSPQTSRKNTDMKMETAIPAVFGCAICCGMSLFAPSFAPSSGSGLFMVLVESFV